MAQQQPDDPMRIAEVFFEELRKMSDMLNGGVRTLISEGWTEQQAREMVSSMLVQYNRSAS